MQVFEIEIPARYDHHVIAYRWHQYRPDVEAANRGLDAHVQKLLAEMRANRGRA